MEADSQIRLTNYKAPIMAAQMTIQWPVTVQYNVNSSKLAKRPNNSHKSDFQTTKNEPIDTRGRYRTPVESKGYISTRPADGLK